MTISGIETAFIANVGSEPEMKTSAAGKPWAAFSACVGDGEDDQWLRVAVFRDRAQQLAGHLHKGDKIYAEGRLKLDTWTGKDGKERTGIKVAAWHVEQLGQIGKNKPAKPKAPPEGEQPAPPSTVPQRDWQKPASAFDEIPF
jgi:single-strand DNA-binding protein